MNSKLGFWRRRAAAEFEPACIAQLIQVELLQRRLRLVQMQGASLPNSQILNSFVYMRPLRKWVLFFIPFWLHAMLIGNPADPSLMSSGIFTSPSTRCTLRMSVFEDFVYQQRYQDEFNLDGTRKSDSFAKLSTDAAAITINFEERVDLYGIVGASQLQLNQEIFSKMQFSWGGGGKLILFRQENFFIGLDVKYFQANQNPLFFVSDGLPLNLVESFMLDYHETQFALGASYRVRQIIPYLYATYLISKIDPNPMTALVRWPSNSTILVDAVCKPVIAERRWGMAVGATLLSAEKAALSVESRMFNQNAIDVNLEIRF